MTDAEYAANQELERKQQMQQAYTLEAEAQQRAAYFIMDMNNDQLGIMTLRKAYEIGYRAGAYAEQRKKNGN
jgi:hypothetical protein